LGYVIERVITVVQRFGEYMKDNRRSRIAYLCTLGVLAQWKDQTEQALTRPFRDDIAVTQNGRSIPLCSLARYL
jgi:hypothetical protein